MVPPDYTVYRVIDDSGTVNTVIFTVQSTHQTTPTTRNLHTPKKKKKKKKNTRSVHYALPLVNHWYIFRVLFPFYFLLPAYTLANQNSFYSKHTIQNDKTEILTQKLKYPKVHLHQIHYHYWLAVSSGTSPDVDTLTLDNCREDNALQLTGGRLWVKERDIMLRN